MQHVAIRCTEFISILISVEKRYPLKLAKKMRVAVVGAGVIGVSSAFAVKSVFPSYDVKIFADAFSPDTTGDGSAGLWTPFLLGDTPAEDIM